MPQIYLPDVPRYDMDPKSDKWIELPGLELNAATLGELFQTLESTTGARMVPDPSSAKFFHYYAKRDADQWIVVDIHILRGEAELCPKQDLHFVLWPDDKIVPAMVVC